MARRSNREANTVLVIIAMIFDRQQQNAYRWMTYHDMSHDERCIMPHAQQSINSPSFLGDADIDAAWIRTRLSLNFSFECYLPSRIDRDLYHTEKSRQPDGA